MNEVVLDGGPLLAEQVVAVARRRAGVRIDPGVPARMAPARAVVERAVAAGRVVYGVTTGFGALATTRIDPAEGERLQVNLLRSHAAGVGEPLGDEVVRAMLLLRARALSQGYSGVRPEVVVALVRLLDADLLPVVPSQGSVGASGDLAPFAHLCLPLIGEGFVKVDGEVRPAAEALSRAGMTPLRLAAKEGLSLLNGTEGMLAMGVLALADADALVAAADVACALSVEALLGSARPFRPEVHAVRPHPGQVRSAARIAALLEGSEIGASHADDFGHAVQDAYCLRCAPQVHGAIADTLGHVRRVLEVELGSAIDNPLVLADRDEVISAGNFHGEPLAFALDFLAIALAELGSISERRIDRLLDPNHSAGLPPFLSARPGLESGFMLAHYTAASLLAENRVLSHPASVESIPTSASQEDHVSMGWGAARKAGQVVDNTTRILAVELLCAAQGVEARAPLRPSSRLARALAVIRGRVPALVGDRPLGPDIEALAALVRDGDLSEEG